MKMPVEFKEKDIQFNLITDALLSEILTEYDLEDWQVVPLINMNETIIDINRKTETAKKVLIKENNAYWFLKEYPWYCSKQKFIEAETKFQKYLRDNGFVIPSILHTHKNKLYVKRLNYDNFFFIQEFVEGDSWNAVLLQTYSAAQTLSKLHNLSREYDKKEYEATQHENIFDLCAQMIDLCESILLKDRTKILKEQVSNLENYFVTARTILANIKRKAFEKGYQNDSIIVHGDYNPANLIYEKASNSVKAVVDFNNMCVDNPVHDIAEGIVHFSYIKYRRHTTFYKALPKGINIEQFTSFLDGYEDKEQLDKAKAYLPEAIASIVLELSALGMICRDYDIEDINHLNKENKQIYSIAKKLVNDYLGHKGGKE